MVLIDVQVRGDALQIGGILRVLMMFWGVAQVLREGCLLFKLFLEVSFYNCKKRCHRQVPPFFCRELTAAHY